MWRVVSGKGQILTTYRGPSSREREGGGEPTGGKGENPNPTRGGEWANGMTCPPGGRRQRRQRQARGGGNTFLPRGPKTGTRSAEQHLAN